MMGYLSVSSDLRMSLSRRPLSSYAVGPGRPRSWSGVPVESEPAPRRYRVGYGPLGVHQT